MCDQGMIGVGVINCNFTEVIYNLVQECSMYGISLENSYYSSVHHNSIVNNVNQAIDTGGGNNTWYDPVAQEGNYWDDYLPPGSYVVSGTSGSEDLYPLSTITISEYNISIPYIVIGFLLLSICIPIIVKRKSK